MAVLHRFERSFLGLSQLRGVTASLFLGVSKLTSSKMIGLWADELGLAPLLPGSFVKFVMMSFGFGVSLIKLTFLLWEL